MFCSTALSGWKRFGLHIPLFHELPTYISDQYFILRLHLDDDPNKPQFCQFHIFEWRVEQCADELVGLVYPNTLGFFTNSVIIGPVLVHYLTKGRVLVFHQPWWPVILYRFACHQIKATELNQIRVFQSKKLSEEICYVRKLYLRQNVTIAQSQMLTVGKNHHHITVCDSWNPVDHRAAWKLLLDDSAGQRRWPSRSTLSPRRGQESCSCRGGQARGRRAAVDRHSSSRRHRSLKMPRWSITSEFSVPHISDKLLNKFRGT